MDYQKEIEYLMTIIKEYVKEHAIENVVLGISGGADSTVVAMLLKKALGQERVHGLLMPNGEQKDIKDSIYICESLGIQYAIRNIEKVYQAMLTFEEFSPKTKTNIAPRIRMTTLYAYAQEHKGIVVGTGNGSEMYIGWCTKHGDMAFDKLAPLLPYTKIEVIELGKVLVNSLYEKGTTEYEAMIQLVEKKPADGLTDASDEENLGFTYQQLHDYQKKGSSGSIAVDEKIQHMHVMTEHKRNQTPIPKSTYHSK